MEFVHCIGGAGLPMPEVPIGFAVPIDDILKETRPAWMAEDYPPDLGILGHTQTRLFAVKEPNPVRWLNNSPV